MESNWTALDLDDNDLVFLFLQNEKVFIILVEEKLDLIFVEILRNVEWL